MGAGWFVTFALLQPLWLLPAAAAPLIEEGFPYPTPTSLAVDSPWTGTPGPSIEVVSGNLSYPGLGITVPAGNLLQMSGGTSQIVYRDFSSSPISGGTVYVSAVVQCTQLPGSSQFIASLMQGGNTSPNQPDDPLDLYLIPATGGYSFRIGHTGTDPVSVRTALAPNTLHFIVLKYTFGSGGQVSIFVDPPTGGAEPSPNARTESGDGSDTPNLQTLLFNASSSDTGILQLDSLRIGAAWADVTPKRNPLTLSGPDNQVVCLGSGASFAVVAAGTPPYAYQWRTNGSPVSGATNSTFTMNSPGLPEAAKNYDVVVTDTYQSVTSSVAHLSFTLNPPAIVTPPVSQPITAGISNATFTVAVTGDAPLSFQWRTNGIAIPGATNSSYTITNVAPADAANLIDIVVANPCGSIVSSPAVSVYYPNQFSTPYDDGAGFFSGENLILTNNTGLSLYAWSSPDPTLPVTGWTLEGPLSELPLGTTGTSRYGINVNPATSPVYYIFALSNTGPYTVVEPLSSLTTPDFATFYLATTNLGISADGIFQFPTPPAITQPPQSQIVLAGQQVNFSVVASGANLAYQWNFKNLTIPGAVGPILSVSNAAPANAGSYSVVVSNSLGVATSSVATLTVQLPPPLQLVSGPAATIQFSANTLTGLTYVVETTTNLLHPVWLPVLTNNTGSSTLVNFQTNRTAGPFHFYRLIFP